ncbi:MAG: winged helix DNA-binding domain-containing protein [Clostridia bacterium]|nr:winged helix DNA-binding domain-containing protein [Clostridia bacterium]
MTQAERKQILLHRHHLIAPADRLTVVRDLCGLQAQFTVNARQALAIRCGEPLADENFCRGLVKNWTIRGTVHIFAETDLPLFCHGTYRYRNQDWSDYRPFSQNEPILAPDQRRCWAEFVLEQVAAGNGERDALKEICRTRGMTDDEMNWMFHPWGGGMRELCERGFLNYAVQEKKAFMLCPPYTPMDTPDAEREMMRRYLAHYAPATLRDMAYFFGWTQAKCRTILWELPHESAVIDGRTYFWSDSLPTDCGDIPRCIFLAGFDPLMLGYRKEDSVFLPPEHLRGIFNLAGIVMPAVLLCGRVVGRWRRKGSRITVESFETLDADAKRAVREMAEVCFPDLRRLDFAE